MKDKKVFIHIGQHKTGTTSIQNFLNINRKILKKNGFIYPNFKSIASHPLAWSFNFGNNHVKESFLKNNPQFKVQVQKELDKAFHQKENIVISSEVFCENINTESMKTIKSKFKDSDVKIICYLRRQDYLFESKFRNTVHFKDFNEDFKNYIKRIIDRPIPKSLPIDAWADMFGKENIIIRPYEKEQLFSQDLVRDFINIIGLKLTSEYHRLNKRSNVGLNNKLVKMFCLINSNPNFTDEQKQKIKKLLLDYKNEFFIKKKDDFSLFSPKTRIEILKKWDESNKRIAREYLGRKDGILFYEPWPDKDEDWIDYDLKVEEIMTIFMKMLLEKQSKVIRTIKRAFNTKHI